MKPELVRHWGRLILRFLVDGAATSLLLDSYTFRASLWHYGCETSGMTRTIEIPLPEELLQLVDGKAHNAGLDRDTYIRAVLSREVAGEPSINEILSSFRTQVAESGITDRELDQLFSEAREESFGNRTQPERK